jgi:organic hydroperoxide reductase OsmC/OhrA
MSEHRIKLNWNRSTPDFNYATYNRAHRVTFKNGKPVEMSASMDYKGDAGMVDPEEMLVASLSSCHMLSFLAIANKYKFIVDSYDDDAAGMLEKNAEGKMAITHVTLRPRVKFSASAAPDASTYQQLHDKAHHACFIANSVKTEVTVEMGEPAGVG